MTMSIDMVIPGKPAANCFPRKLASNLSPAFITAAAPIRPYSFKCINAIPDHTDQITATTTRRSGNFNPTLWDFNYIQSLSSEYRSDRCLKRVSELVLQVRILLEKEMEGVKRLELIDNLQNMGISYHFDEKIKQILNCMHLEAQQKCLEEERDLYSTALEFRLLRQHGFSVSQDVFDCFKNEKGGFKSSLAEDTKGLLQLYEASFLLTEDEETLEVAREFSRNFLQKKLEDGLIDDANFSLMVRHALELPLHWRVQRINARWSIDAYARSIDMNPLLLHLAKLDFNILQETYQEEIKHVSRWWEETSLAKKLPFARDRVVECYMFALGQLSQPQYGYLRILISKTNLFVTVIDDIFDVYGTIEELHLFNDIIQRWDIEAIDQLPDYMQICFLALNNFVDEVAYNVLKEQGFLIIPYLRKSWADMIRREMQEAKWYNEGYTPSLEEYLHTSYFTGGVPAMLTHEFFMITNPIKKEAVESLYKYHNIVRCASIIVRLANDIGPPQDETERDDVAKSVRCYMNESGANRKEAVEYIKHLIGLTWKHLNEEANAESPFSQDFVTSAMNVGRISQFMYLYGDGNGLEDLDFKHLISALLFDPIL